MLVSGRRGRLLCHMFYLYVLPHLFFLLFYFFFLAPPFPCLTFDFVSKHLLFFFLPSSPSFLSSVCFATGEKHTLRLHSKEIRARDGAERTSHPTY
ncbi:hypothetical protein J3F83DRAFT_133933 [Trichoderma novae-zelandiae]